MRDNARQVGHHTFARAVLNLGAVRLAAVLLGFGTGVLGARYLGPAGLGAASVALTVGLITGVIFNGGINIAVIYLLGRRRDDEDVIVGSLSVIAGVASVGAFVFAVVTWPVIGPLAGVAGREYLGPVAAIVSASVIWYEFGGAVILGFGRMGSYTVSELARGGATFAFTWLLLSLATGDGAFVLAASLGYAVSAGASFFVARRTMGHWPRRWDMQTARGALAIGGRGQIGNVLQYLNLRLDQLLVPALLNLQAAGIYAIAVRASEVVAQVASAASSLIFPSVAADEDIRSTELTERTVRIAILLVSAAALVLGLIAEPLLTLAFGEAFRSGVLTLRTLLVAMVPLTAARVLAGDLKGRGRPGLVSLVMVSIVALTAILDVTLIPVFGIEGAAVASVIAYTASAMLLAVAFSRVTGARMSLLLPAMADLRTIASGSARIWRQRMAGTPR